MASAEKNLSLQQSHASNADGDHDGDVMVSVPAERLLSKKGIPIPRDGEVDPRVKDLMVQELVAQGYDFKDARAMVETGAMPEDVTERFRERAEMKEQESLRESKMIELLTTQYGLTPEEAKAVYIEEKARVDAERAQAADAKAEAGVERSENAAGEARGEEAEKSWFAKAKEGVMKSIEVGKKAGKLLWRNKEKVTGAIAAGGLVAATGGGVLLVPAAAAVGAGLGKFGKWLTMEGGFKVVGEMGKAYANNKEFRYTVNKSVAEIGKRMLGAKLLVEGGHYLQHQIDKTMGWESAMRTERSMFVQMEKKHDQRTAIEQKFETLTSLLGEKGSKKYQVAVKEYNLAIADAKLPKSEEEQLKRELGLHLRASRKQGKLAYKGEKKEMMTILKNRIKAQETWGTVVKESLNMVLAAGGLATGGAAGSAMMWARTGAYEAITAVEKGLKEKRAYEAEGASKFTVKDKEGNEVRTVSALDQNIRRIERRLYGKKTMELTTDKRLEFQARKKALEMKVQQSLEKIRPQYEQVQGQIDALVMGQSDLEFSNASDADKQKLSELIAQKERLYASVGIQNADSELMRIGKALQSGSLYEERTALSNTERIALEQQLQVLQERKKRSEAYDQAQGFGGRTKVIAGTLIYNAREMSLELVGKGHEAAMSYDAKTGSYSYGGGGGGGERGGGMNEKVRRQEKFRQGMQAWSRVLGFAGMAAGPLIREILHNKDIGPIVINQETGMPEVPPGTEITPEIAARLEKMQADMSHGLFNKLEGVIRDMHHEGETGAKATALAGLENYTLSALGRMKSFTRVVDMPRIACRQVLQWDEQATTLTGQGIDWAATKLGLGSSEADETVGATTIIGASMVDYGALTRAAGIESAGGRVDSDDNKFARVDAVHGTLQRMVDSYQGHDKQQYAEFIQNYAKNALGGYELGVADGQIDPSQPSDQWSQEMLQEAHRRYLSSNIARTEPLPEVTVSADADERPEFEPPVREREVPSLVPDSKSSELKIRVRKIDSDLQALHKLAEQPVPDGADARSGGDADKIAALMKQREQAQRELTIAESQEKIAELQKVLPDLETRHKEAKANAETLQQDYDAAMAEFTRLQSQRKPRESLTIEQGNAQETAIKQASDRVNEAARKYNEANDVFNSLEGQLIVQKNRVRQLEFDIKKAEYDLKKGRGAKAIEFSAGQHVGAPQEDPLLTREGKAIQSLPKNEEVTINGVKYSIPAGDRSAFDARIQEIVADIERRNILGNQEEIKVFKQSVKAEAEGVWQARQDKIKELSTIPVERQRYYEQVPGAKHPDEFVRDELGEHAGMEVQSEEDVKEGMAIFDDAEERLNRLFQGGQITDAKMKEANAEYLTSCYEAAMRKLGGEMKLGRAATVEEFVQEWGKGHEYAFPKIKAKMEAGTLTLADLVQANIEDRRARIESEVIPMLDQHPIFKNLPDNVKKGTVHAIELLDLTEGPSRWGKLDKQEWRDRAHTRILKVMFGIDKEGNFLDGWEKAPYRSYVADKYADMTPDERKEDAMKIGGWVDLHSRAHIKAIHEHDGTYGLPGVKKGVTGDYIPELPHVMRLKKARELEIWTMAHYFMGEKKMPPPPPPEILKEQLMNDVEEVEAILRLEEQARAGKRTEVGVHYSDVLGEIEGPKAETLKDIKAQVELMGFNPDKIAQMRYFNPATRKWETFFDGTKGFDASKLANIDDFEKFYCVDDEGRPITFRKTFEQRPDGSTWEHFAAETKAGGDQPTFFSVTRERLPDGTESMQVSVGEHGEIQFGYTGGKGEIDWAGLHAELDKLKDPHTGQINMNADTAFRFANLFGQNMKEGTGASFALKYGEWNFAFGDFEKVDSEEGGTGVQWNTTEISSDRFNWQSDVDSKVVIHADGTNEMVLGGKGGEAIRIMGQGMNPDGTPVDAKTVADRWMALGAPDGGLDAIEKYRLAAGLDKFDLNVDMGAIDRAFNARPGTKEALLKAFIGSANHDLQARLEVGQEAGKFDIQNMGEGLDKLKAAELGISYDDFLALKKQQVAALEGGAYTTFEELLSQNPNVVRLSEGESKQMAEGVIKDWYRQVTGQTPEERAARIGNAWLQAESRLLDDREAMFSDNYGDQLHLIAGQHMDEAGYLTKMSTSRGFAFGHRGEKGMWYVGAEEEDFYARSGALRDVGPDAMMTVEMRGQMQKMYAGFERECLMKGFTLGARGMYGKGETGPGVLVAEGENGQKYQIAEVFKGTEREIWVIEGKAQYEGNISDEFKVTARIKGMPGLDPEKMMALAQDKIPGAKSLKLLTRIGVGIQSKHGFSIGGEFSPEVIGTGTHRIHGGYNKQVGDLRLGVGGEMMRFGQGGFKLAKVSASANYELGGFNVGGEVSVGGSEGVEYTINVGNKEIPVSLMDLLSADPKILAMRVGFEVGKKGFSEALDAITDAQENARLQKLGPLFADSFTEHNAVDMELGKKGGELFGLYERYHNLESADNVSAADKQKQMTEIVTAMLKKRVEIEQYSGDSHIIHDKIVQDIENLKTKHGATAPTAAEVTKMDVGRPAQDLMWQKRDVGLVTDNGTVKVDYRGPEEKFEIHLSDTMKDAADQEFAAIGDEKTRHIAMAYRELLKRSSDGAHTDILARLQEDLRQRIQKHADTVDPFEIQEKLGILLDDKDAKAEQLLEMTHEKLMKDKNFDKLADLAEANLSDKYKASAREILGSWQVVPTNEEFEKELASLRGGDMVQAWAKVKERQATMARIQEQHAQLEAAFHASAHERAVTKMDEAAILQEVDGKLKGDKAVLTSRELWAIERRMKAKDTLTESAAAALQELRRQAGFKGTATIEHRKGLDFLIDSLAGKKARARTPDIPSHEMPMVSADRIPSSGTADEYAQTPATRAA